MHYSPLQAFIYLAIEVIEKADTHKKSGGDIFVLRRREAEDIGKLCENCTLHGFYMHSLTDTSCAGKYESPNIHLDML